MDRQLLECFIRLRNDPSFAPFREWVKRERETVRDRLETVEEAGAVRFLQGRAQALKELEKFLNSAIELAEKARSQKHGGRVV